MSADTKTEPTPAELPPGSASPGVSIASFEASIRRLGEIVQALERGDLALEDSLKLFEEGVRLSRSAQERLDSAEKRIEQLLGVDEEGKAQTAPFSMRGERD